MKPKLGGRVWKMKLCFAFWNYRLQHASETEATCAHYVAWLLAEPAIEGADREARARTANGSTLM
jgi:hypothetical protein